MSFSEKQILAMPGIVIRLIPEKEISKWIVKKGEKGAVYDPDTKRFNITRERTFKYGNKYLLTFDYTQGSTVQFNIKYHGVGVSIIEAYQDYIFKNIKGL